MSKTPNYYIVEADALPEIFRKVVEARRMLDTGEAETVNQAVQLTGISRSAFYKYRDAVRPFQDMLHGRIVTFQIMMKDEPGILSQVLNFFADSGANILTINQGLPINGCAVVTVNAETSGLRGSLQELLAQLTRQRGFSGGRSWQANGASHRIQNKGWKQTMVNVAILGFGVVGSGVAEVLTGTGEGIHKKADDLLALKYILDVRQFPDSPFAGCFVQDFSVIENDPEVQVVVETIGGMGAALDFTERALKAGKSVVTSNKELVATHGRRLLALAAEHQAVYLFEASVGGGIPILRPLSECMAANAILEICGILNGTANYIFTRMVQDGIPFAQALKGAQANGYAEQDPSADVEGKDTCRKLCILSSIAFGWQLLPEQVPTTGITQITLEDEAYAAACGRRIKLLGRAIAQADGKVCAYVEPHFVGQQDPLAGVEDVFNAILVKGDATGDVMFYGRGAGKLPTASAVVADVIAAARQLERASYRPWSPNRPEAVVSPDTLATQWYVRLAQGTLEGERLTIPGAAEGESGWLTPAMTRPELEQQLAGKAVLAVIRVLD